MDQCYDMIDIERQFGKVQLGHEESQPVTFKRQPVSDKAPDPMWMKLSEFLTYNPSKMEKFKQLIDQAQIDKNLDYEKQRKKVLEDFLMRKRSKKFGAENLGELIKQNKDQDAE